MLTGKPGVLAAGAALFAAAFMHLLAPGTVGQDRAQRHAAELITAQATLPAHGAAELVLPQQTPVFRTAGRSSHAVRGKAPAKTKKPLALAHFRAMPAPGPAAAARDRSANAEPRCFALLRSQKARAPPLSPAAVS